MILILRTNKTQGPTEYLFYGAVGEDAIIGVLNIRDLVQSKYSGDFSSVLKLDLILQAPYAAGLGRKVRKEAGMLTYKTGQVVGRFLELASVNPHYWEALSWYS